MAVMADKCVDVSKIESRIDYTFAFYSFEFEDLLFVTHLPLYTNENPNSAKSNTLLWPDTLLNWLYRI